MFENLKYKAALKLLTLSTDFSTIRKKFSTQKENFSTTAYLQTVEKL